MLRWAEITSVVALISAGAAYGIGHHQGAVAVKAQYEAITIKAQKAQMAAADLASQNEALRLAEQAKNDGLSRQLEDAATAQVASGPCLSITRVMRLNSR